MEMRGPHESSGGLSCQQPLPEQAMTMSDRRDAANGQLEGSASAPNECAGSVDAAEVELAVLSRPRRWLRPRLEVFPKHEELAQEAGLSRTRRAARTIATAAVANVEVSPRRRRAAAAALSHQMTKRAGRLHLAGRGLGAEGGRCKRRPAGLGRMMSASTWSGSHPGRRSGWD